MSKLPSALAAALGLCLLGACGQKGPLYLAPRPALPAKGPANPAPAPPGENAVAQPGQPEANAGQNPAMPRPIAPLSGQVMQ